MCAHVCACAHKHTHTHLFLNQPIQDRMMPLVLFTVNASWHVFMARLRTSHLRDYPGKGSCQLRPWNLGGLQGPPLPLRPLRDLLCHFNSFYKWENWGSEKLSDLVKVILVIISHPTLRMGFFPTTYTATQCVFIDTYFYWCSLSTDQYLVLIPTKGNPNQRNGFHIQKEKAQIR